MKKITLAGIFFVIFLSGVAVILSHDHVSFKEFVRSLSHLNPRALSFIALPFVVLLFVLGVYLRRRREARMWKKAVLKTRARKHH